MKYPGFGNAPPELSPDSKSIAKPIRRKKIVRFSARLAHIGNETGNSKPRGAKK
jgi:hypothetical protein